MFEKLEKDENSNSFFELGNIVKVFKLCFYHFIFCQTLCQTRFLTIVVIFLTKIIPRDFEGVIKIILDFIIFYTLITTSNFNDLKKMSRPKKY